MNEERIEFNSFNDFLDQSSRVQIMFSRDGKRFYDNYDEMQSHYGGDILLPHDMLKEDRKYYIIKAK